LPAINSLFAIPEKADLQVELAKRNRQQERPRSAWTSVQDNRRFLYKENIRPYTIAPFARDKQFIRHTCESRYPA
jgi:hypothetical protein